MVLVLISQILGIYRLLLRVETKIKILEKVKASNDMMPLISKINKALRKHIYQKIGRERVKMHN